MIPHKSFLLKRALSNAHYVPTKEGISIFIFIWSATKPRAILPRKASKMKMPSFVYNFTFSYYSLIKKWIELNKILKIFPSLDGWIDRPLDLSDLPAIVGGQGCEDTSTLLVFRAHAPLTRGHMGCE